MNNKQSKWNGKKSTKKNKKRDVDFSMSADAMKQKAGLNFKYVSVPLAKGRQVRIVEPTLQGSGKSFIVKHREYLFDVAGSAPFTNNYITVNPGLPITFPWGSGIAKNYEQYRIRSLKFLYETQAPTTEPGTVMLAMDYDPADAPPGDKPSFMSMAGAVRTPVWAGLTLSVDPQRRAFEKLFVRTGPLGPDLDVKTYDYGVMNIAVQGSNPIELGELYVEYEIELFTPASTQENDVSVYERCGNYLARANYDPTQPFGTSWAKEPPSGGLEVTRIDSSKISILRQGTYFLSIQGAGTACTGLIPDVTVASGLGSVQNLYCVNLNNANDGMAYSMTLVVGVGGATFQFDYAESATTVGTANWAYKFRPEQLSTIAPAAPYNSHGRY